MPIAEKQIRVFISSTFRDMQAERDHLVTVVFPELRERVEQLGLEFFDVDLRWGVPAKDLNGETANSWEYCRQWIDRVEPFFVCILGQRYGWVPEPRHFRDTADQQRQQREPRSITDLEVRHAVLDARRKRRSYFYLRATPVTGPNAEYVDPTEYQIRLEELKTAVRYCGRPVREYRPEWTGQGFVGLTEFGDVVLDDLWSGVLRDERFVSKAAWRQALNADPDADPRYTDESQPVPRELWTRLLALAKPAPQDPLEAERQQMKAFAASRLRWFHGRTRELEELIGFIGATDADAPHLAVVAAAPGQGKSALMAKLSERIQESEASGQKPPFVVTHFVGATERSATAHVLVQRLLDELDYGIKWPAAEVNEGGESKRDFNSLCNRLRQRLGEYDGDRRIVILLDALNQLTDGHDLRWLPGRLGPSVHIVVSCAETESSVQSPESRVLHALASLQRAPLRVRLGPLTEDDVRTIVIEYLREYCKELDREHVDAICRMEHAQNPLYLLVMLGELRTLGDNDMNRIVGERIAALARDFPDTVSLFRWVLRRLEVFGPEAVRWWCLYLAYGRVGMASLELADLLAQKLDPNAASTALQVERGLRRYLLRRGGQLDFSHGQLRQAVTEQYGPHADPAAVHRELADYFAARAKGADPQKEWETGGVRGFAECVFHLTKAERYDSAAERLTDFLFLLNKLRARLLESLFEDYDLLAREAPANTGERLAGWSDFFREKAHILRRGNEKWQAHKILLQLAIEHADDCPLTAGAERFLDEGHCDWPWVRSAARPPHAQKDPCLTVLEGHRLGVTSVGVSPDGLRATSGSSDQTLRVWDLESGQCQRTLEIRNRLETGVSLAPDGRRAVSVDEYDTKVRVWDLETGQCLRILEGHRSNVSCMDVAPDSRRMITGAGGNREFSDDYSLRVWDLDTGQCLHVLEGHRRGVTCVSISPDGRRAVSGSSDRTLRIWDLDSGQCLRVLDGHTNGINCVAVTPDGRRAVSGGGGTAAWWDSDEDRTLRVWDLDSGQCSRVLAEQRYRICCVSVSPDGRRAISGGPDRALRIWDLESGDCLQVLDGHKHRVNCVIFAPGGNRAVSGSDDRTLRIWNTDAAQRFETPDRHGHTVMSVSITSNGRYVVSASTDDTLRVWDFASGKCRRTLEGHRDRVLCASLTPDGRRAVSGSADRSLRIWDLESGECIRTLEGHRTWVRSVVISPDGDRAVSISCKTTRDDKVVRVWDLNRGLCLRELAGHGDAINCVKITPDGRRAVSASSDHTLRVWDLASGRCLRVLEGHDRGINCVAVTPDGRRAISGDGGVPGLFEGGGDNSLRIWDLDSGACLQLEGHGDGVEMVSLSPAGGHAIVARLDNTLEYWDLNSRACVHVLEGHGESVSDVSLSPDGRFAVSAGRDKTLRVWDLDSGDCVAIYHLDASAMSVAFSPIDNRIVCGAEGGQMYFLTPVNFPPCGRTILTA